MNGLAESAPEPDYYGPLAYRELVVDPVRSV